MSPLQLQLQLQPQPQPHIYRLTTAHRGYAHELLRLERLYEDGHTESATYQETLEYFEGHPALQQFGSWVCAGTNYIHYCTD